MSITIRLATPADAFDMAEVGARSFETVFRDILPEKYIREKKATYPSLYSCIITDKNTTHYVIQKDSKTICITCVTPPVTPPIDDNVGDNYCELGGIWLHPDYFRQGIGTKAMSLIFDTVRSQGKKVMLAWALEKTLPSLNFMKNAGLLPMEKQHQLM